MKNLTRYLILLFLAVNISTNYNAQVIYNGGFEEGDYQGYSELYGIQVQPVEYNYSDNNPSNDFDYYWNIDISADFLQYWKRGKGSDNYEWSSGNSGYELDNGNTNPGHSPDWNYAGYFNSHIQHTRPTWTGGPLTPAEIIPAHSGNGSLDMAQNELIQQKFNKTELMQQIADAQFVVDPKLRLKLSIHLTDGWHETTDFKVIFSKKQIKYKKNGDFLFDNIIIPFLGIDINQFWKIKKRNFSQLKSNPKEVIFSANNLMNQYGNTEWYQIDELIDIPDDIADYNWISFHVVKKYKKFKKTEWLCGSDKKGWLEEYMCDESDFVMLDDISLAVEECEETCNNTDGKHEFLVSNLIANNENIVIDELSNITKLSIAVVSLTGQLIYQNQVECLNGIDHPIYYDGLGISNGTYYCEITAENDCYTTKRTIGFVKSAPYIGPNVTNFSQGCSNGVNPTPEICCELQGGDNYTINNQILVGPPYSEYLVRDGIYACNATNTFSDEVRVNNGSNILFRAGLEIELNEGFQTQQGAVFLAEIAPSHCDRPAGRGSKYKNEKIKNEDKERAELPNIENSNEISAFPNPSNGTFNVEALNAVSENVLIEVFDMLGSRCYSKEQAGFKQIQISLENVNKGVFFVKVTSANKSLSTKLIIH
ncbi:T9SS type A sorting domain-containing protein [Flavobacteriales bacterium]|nr:T9SS type A sorting domain-containing protein [Flavobacteriales bacterium]